MTEDQIKVYLQKIILENYHLETDPIITKPDEKFGDYSTNIALQLAKTLKQNPLQIAETISHQLQDQFSFQKIETKPPGFINIYLADQTIIDELRQTINQNHFGQTELYKNQKIVTEFSDPNPFKVLHVGHLYTSIIGDAISNIIEQAGGQVYRVNFGGDVGLHVAKSIWGIIKSLGGEFPDKLNTVPNNQRVEWLVQCYIEGNTVYEQEQSVAEEIKLINQKIYQIQAEQDHQSNLAQIYWTCRQWSYDYFDQFYQTINVKFDKYYPESQTFSIGLKTVQEQLQKGHFETSQGAVIFPGEKYGLHSRVFINQQGLPTYETKDIGLNLLKWQDYHFDQSIIITGNDIQEYMKVILKAMEQIKPELSQKTIHLTHGNVKLVGGIKMSSRKGNFIQAYDLIDLVQRTTQQVSQTKPDFDLVLSAIKYSFLKQQIGPDLIFDPQESIKLKGNTGVYLQYSLVRAKSILQKAQKHQDQITSQLDQFEKRLILKFLDYPNLVLQSTHQLKPNLICNYLYELSQLFNQFYENDQILDSPNQNFRLTILEAYILIMEKAFKMLGLPIMNKISPTKTKNVSNKR